jgi:hypothetical protein
VTAPTTIRERRRRRDGDAETDKEEKRKIQIQQEREREREANEEEQEEEEGDLGQHLMMVKKSLRLIQHGATSRSSSERRPVLASNATKSRTF